MGAIRKSSFATDGHPENGFRQGASIASDLHEAAGPFVAVAAETISNERARAQPILGGRSKLPAKGKFAPDIR